MTVALPADRRRKATSLLFKTGAYLALLLVIGPAAWLVISIVARALPHWQWSVITTAGTGTTGGLRNEIIGTLILGAGVFVMAGTIGILAGIWLAEVSGRGRSARAVAGLFRSAIEILSGFPSIVLGYVGYVALVIGLHWSFGLLPAFIVLSIMVVPYIAKATESSLNQVPTGYREGAEALGMSMGYGLRKVVIKSALPGIVTGLLIALAIALGETAPVIYTAGTSTALPTGLTHSQVPYLTYPVFKFFDEANKQANYLAYDAALILVVIVLLLLVSARIIVARTQRHSESRGV